MATETKKNTDLGVDFNNELLRLGFARSALVLSAGSNANADLWMRVDGTPVLVELCAYRRKEFCVDAEYTAMKLEELMTRRMERREPFNGLRVFIAYRRSAKSVVEVPKGHRHKEFVDECEGMLAELTGSSAWQPLTQAVLLFDPSAIPPVMSDQQLNYADKPIIPIDPLRYPTMAKACYGLMVKRTTPGCFILFESDQNRRSQPADEDAVRTLARGKQSKLKRYRANADGAPCWLVIHSEGRPLSAWVFKEFVPGLAAIASEELSGHADAFDAAYWFNRDELGMGQTIVPIATAKRG